MSGEVVFKLYDTFGFPHDLTEIVAARARLRRRPRRLREGARRASSRAASSRARATRRSRDVYPELRAELGDTEFTGYREIARRGAASAPCFARASAMQQAAAGEEVEIVTDRTPFYGESGGQVGDAGTLVGRGGAREIVDVQKPVGRLDRPPGARSRRGDFAGRRRGRAEGRRASARQRIRANHSATHLLHWALKKVLGDHVKQAGSVVAPDYLRFDYTHFQAPAAGGARRGRAAA